MAGEDIVTGDGEIIEANVPMILDDAMAGTLARAEIDMQVATAHQYPRSVKRAIDNILSLATLDEQTALENIYALKRGGKPIRGPSIRLAEIIAQQWGNCRIDARVISIDRQNKTLMAEGTFHDLETNVATRATVQRSISTSKGYLFSHDMIAVAGQAATSIARRNAILAGVPKGVWRRAVEASEQIIRGDAKTLIERRDAAIKAFAHFNLSPEQVFAIMDVAGADDIDLDDLVTLRAIYASLKNGEQTVEELLRSKQPAAEHKAVKNPLDDRPQPEGGEGEQTDSQANAEPKPAADDKKAKGKDKPAKDDKPTKEDAAAGKPKDERTPEEIAAASDAAYARGEEAKAKGMTPKAMPAEFKAKGREIEAVAWMAGFEGRDLRQPGEEG